MEVSPYSDSHRSNHIRTLHHLTNTQNIQSCQNKSCNKVQNLENYRYNNVLSNY
jgi:hypothetical protein